MTRPAGIVLIALALAAGSWLLWRAAERVYLVPRAQLVGRLDAASERVQSYEEALDAQRALQRDLGRVAQRTLGGDREAVDHRLRSRLGRIAEEIGLAGAVVNTGSPTARQNPGRQVFAGRGELMRSLRDEVDFFELDGSITGEGTLEQVVALVDRIEAEPWIKRVHSLRLEPKQNGERFAATLRLTTLFMPGSEAASGEATTDEAYDAGRLARFASLLAANPFRLPPPGRPQPPRPESPAGPPPFAYADWLLTGLAVGREGDEAWLRNGRTGENRRLAAGERIGEAVFVGAAGDEGEFMVGESRFLITIGADLARRTPVKK
jgi:hypothetical protein